MLELGSRGVCCCWTCRIRPLAKLSNATAYPGGETIFKQGVCELTMIVSAMRHRAMLYDRKLHTSTLYCLQLLETEYRKCADKRAPWRQHQSLRLSTCHAATLDGGTPLQILRRVAMPSSKKVTSLDPERLAKLCQLSPLFILIVEQSYTCPTLWQACLETIFGRTDMTRLMCSSSKGRRSSCDEAFSTANQEYCYYSPCGSRQDHFGGCHAKTVQHLSRESKDAGSHHGF